MNIFYVYGYTDPESFEPYMYIGKGSGNRVRQHLIHSENNNDLDYSSRFYCKLRKMRESNIDPIIEIIKDELAESDAFELEIELIAKYGRINIGTGCLYNLTDGGDGNSGGIGSFGYKHSIEARTKISIAVTKQNLDPKYQTALIRGRRKKRGKPVRSFNLTTRETIKRYECMNDVTLDNFNQAHVWACCCGKECQHAGLGWEYD